MIYSHAPLSLWKLNLREDSEQINKLSCTFHTLCSYQPLDPQYSAVSTEQSQQLVAIHRASATPIDETDAYFCSTQTVANVSLVS